MSRLLALLCFVLLVPVVEASAASCVIPRDHPILGKTYWYGLYYEEQKIGHAMASLDQVEDDDEVSFDLRFEMTFKLEQAEETIRQGRSFAAAPPHQLIGGYYQTADREIGYIADGPDLVMIEQGGERIWSGLERTLCDEEDVAIHRFLQAEPAAGDELITNDFDVEHLALLESRHIVEEVETRLVLGADHHFHRVRSRSDNPIFPYNVMTEFQNGDAVHFFLGPLEFRAETEAIAREPNIGVDLFAAFVQPLNRPLRNLDRIRDLTLKLRIDDPATTIDDVVDDRFLQRVDYLDDQTAVVHLGDHEAPPPLADQSTGHLKPTSLHPADDPRIVELAQEVRATAKDPDDPWSVALGLMAFVADYIETVPQSPYVYHTTSVFDILDNRTGDCTEHSQLFVTLAKALSIPAREVTGYIYGGDDRNPSLSGHAWVEVLIDDRWIGLDPTWGEAELNRSHIQIRNNFVQGLRFEVLDINYL